MHPGGGKPERVWVNVGGICAVGRDVHRIGEEDHGRASEVFRIVSLVAPEDQAVPDEADLPSHVREVGATFVADQFEVLFAAVVDVDDLA